DAVAGHDVEPIIRNLLRDGRRGKLLLALDQRRRVGSNADRRGRPGIFERQIEREARALAGDRAQLDLAAEQARELAADRKPKTGAAVFAARARVRLLERLEDDALLLERNADAGVRHLERHHGGLIEQRVIV